MRRIGPFPIVAVVALLAIASSLPISADGGVARLRIAHLSFSGADDGASLPVDGSILSSTASPYDERRNWDGNDPFDPPLSTTDYYGSGDVDLDGRVTAFDVEVAQQIVRRMRPANVRADLDGSGQVDDADVVLLADAVNGGGMLPGWWHSLTREGRNAWLDRVLSVDPVDQLYSTSWFVCGQFATQMALRGAFYYNDLNATYYDNGATVYNIPLYNVIVASEEFGHEINAVLVGDDPLSFDDWRFIEPQNDLDVHPGMWNMPYGAMVDINAIHHVGAGAKGGDSKVRFHVDESGAIVSDYDPALRLSRPVDMTSPDGRAYLWNPRILPVGSGLLFFERSRDDLLRVPDIHLATLPFTNPLDGMALTYASNYSRLLDVAKGSDGAIHLLWAGKSDYDPGVFYGQLYLTSRTLSDVRRICSGCWGVRMGRLLPMPNGQIHAFWVDSTTNIHRPHQPGIYWTANNGTGWQPAQLLTPGMLDPSWLEGYDNTYLFDVAADGQGKVVLAWMEPLGDARQYRLTQLLYDGEWAAPAVIDAAAVRGVDLVADSAGLVHLAYWRAQDPGELSWSGNVVHRIYDGVRWTAPEVLDAGGNAGYSRLASDDKGGVHVVWTVDNGSQVVPVWRYYTGGAWSAPRELSIPEGADAWYPTVEWLSSGVAQFAWSERSAGGMTIGLASVLPEPPTYWLFLPAIQAAGDDQELP